jgi:hypothetical protein
LAAAPASTKRRKKSPKAEAEDDLLANGRCSGLREQIACKILQGIRDKQPIGSISAGNLTGVEADLSKLQELRDSGTISEDEFQQLRKKTLGL